MLYFILNCNSYSQYRIELNILIYSHSFPEMVLCTIILLFLHIIHSSLMIFSLSMQEATRDHVLSTTFNKTMRLKAHFPTYFNFINIFFFPAVAHRKMRNLIWKHPVLHRAYVSSTDHGLAPKRQTTLCPADSWITVSWQTLDAHDSAQEEHFTPLCRTKICLLVGIHQLRTFKKYQTLVER